MIQYYYQIANPASNPCPSVHLSLHEQDSSPYIKACPLPLSVSAVHNRLNHIPFYSPSTQSLHTSSLSDVGSMHKHEKVQTLILRQPKSFKTLILNDAAITNTAFQIQIKHSK